MASSQQLILGQVPATGGGGGAYQISRSLRFNSADSAYLSRTPGSAGNRRTWTWSAWVKFSVLSSDMDLFGVRIDGNNQFRFYRTSANKLDVYNQIGGSIGARLITTQLFRDVSAWYHFVLTLDTTNATAGDRMRLYVNGSEVTAFDTDTQPSQNYDTQVNTTNLHEIGSFNTVASLNGYLANINFIDGQALTPSSFGQTNSTTGVWEPIAYTGTYGTNGFFLDFADNSSTAALGYDAAGSNDWTVNNFSVTAGAGNDSLVDTPTPYGTDTGAGGEVRGNYATLNPLTLTYGTLSNGNLNYVGNGTNHDMIVATSGQATGKWYCEVTLTNAVSADQYSLSGVVNLNSYTPGYSPTYPGGNAASWGYYPDDGGNPGIYNNAARTDTVAAGATNDVIGMALDCDAGTLAWYKNNSLLITKTIGSGNWAFVVGHYSANCNINFGQRPFAYTAPSGFKALVTTNLPTPTVVQGDEYFNTILYTGTGSSNARTGVGFQPDLVWIKERNASADHALYDAVRGVQQQLESNTTTDETTESTGLTAFGSDGFTVGSLAQVNTNNDTYVAWCWKESTTSKFDIVTYTGNGTARTISHNLGVVPNMIIVKARTTASTDQGWPVYHSANTANPETDYLLLNTTAATADLDTVWNDTAPTSSVFSVGTNALVNANNDTYVAYLFANVAGYSAFGSYTGNGSADGPFVYTGFRPAFLIVKASSSTSEWFISDAARNPSNIVNKRLQANAANAEDTQDNFDYLSNGFKLRAAAFNNSGVTFIYIAFAENPFKYSLAR